jgi:hypothetical protein
MIFLLLIFNIGRVDVLADGLSVFSYVAAPAVGFPLLVSCLLTFVVLGATVARRESGDWPDLRAIARLFSSLRKETKSLISNSLFKRKGIPGKGITIVVAGGEENSISNKLKRWFEGVTGQKWNCWPFAPTFLPLQSDHSRIKFKFVSLQMIPSMTLCLFRQRPSTEDARIGWTSLQSFCRLQKDNAETLLFSRVLRMIAYLMEVAARTCLRDHPLTGVHHQQHQSEHRHYHLETTLQEETRNPQEINSRLRKLRPRDQYCSPKSDGRLRAFVGTRSSIPPKRQASTCTD